MKRTQISRRPSKRKQAFDAEYAAVLPSVLARGCEFVKYVITSEVFGDGMEYPPGYNPQCRGRDTGHHAKGRRVRDANDPANLRCLCERHHAFVESQRAWAMQVGLLVSRIS